ncbi:GntR family transcriptional regulator [Salipiger sp. P9]|uniref:GntR family transcriptional regulator n=1 Tax=Salipiger pentaromativorans TaxID=2943193 RepID=UPI002157AE93|nr:GntR family transcriptional regulator [Salipiger pentaromativorans]MCR8549249.1 GntR family transcriptional regulator [Salipiger pentaromativorans]
MTKSTPTHRKIADEIRRRIIANEYQHDQLPPERLLIAEFKVSRHTIRAALQQLVNDGLITRTAGRGTQIVREGRGGYWAIGALEDLTGEFRVDQQLTISAQLEPAEHFPKVSKMFGLGKDDQIFRVQRILTNNGLPYSFSHLFAEARMTKDIPDNRLGTAFFVDLVQEYSGRVATRARQAITAALADAEISRRLGMEQGAPVLIVRRTYFTADDHPLVYVELYCRPDRYEQVVNLIRDSRLPNAQTGVPGVPSGERPGGPL